MIITTLAQPAIKAAILDRARVLAVIGQAPKPLPTMAIEPQVELRRGRLELLLKVLGADGAVRRVSGGANSAWRLRSVHAAFALGPGLAERLGDGPGPLPPAWTAFSSD